VPYGAGGFSFAGADKMLTRSGATLPKIAIFWGKSSVLTQQKVNSAHRCQIAGCEGGASYRSTAVLQSAWNAGPQSLTKLTLEALWAAGLDLESQNSSLMH
jgi:hypothetical protein